MTGSNIRRMRRRFGTMALSLVACLSIAACGHSQDSEKTPGSDASSDAFVSVLRGVSMDYEPHVSPEDLGREAELSIVGTVKSIDDGRVFGVGPTRETEPVFLNVTLTVHVENVLEGDPSLIDGNQVFVELSRSKEYPVERFRESIPINQRLILFLSDYSEGLGSFPLIEKASSIPEGSVIFAPYAEGLLVEDSETGAIIGGYEPLAELAPSWREATGNIDEFVDRHFLRA